MSHHFFISSHSVEDTRRIGQVAGENLSAGITLALTGDLGSGKTALVQGLAQGLGVPDRYYITSPSYTLVHEYPGRCPLFHLDLYRLSDNDFDDIGLTEILSNRTAVVAIEWAEKLPANYLTQYLIIQIDIGGDETRNLCFATDGNYLEPLLFKLESRLKEKLWH